jgi:hypothetical protein
LIYLYAVIISLYLAFRSSKVKLNVSGHIFPKVRQNFDEPDSEDKNLSPEHFDLFIRIHNKGKLPAYINFHDYIYFKSFFFFGALKPLQNTPLRINVHEIAPTRRINLSVTKHDLKNIAKIIGRKYHRLYLITHSGEKFRIKLHKDNKKIS